MRGFIQELKALGFGKKGAISGADVVECINQHWNRLKELDKPPKEKPQGGPAFPGSDGEWVHDGQLFIQSPYAGMTLRQWYKGMAIQTIFAKQLKDDRRNSWLDIANQCGKLADALIAEDGA